MEKEQSNIITPEEAALGTEQYSPEYTVTADATDTQISYAVGGRPAVITPRTPASYSYRRPAQAATNRTPALIAVVALVTVGAAAAGFFLLTRASKHAHTQTNVSTTTDQASVFDPTKPVPDTAAAAIDQKIIKSAAYLTRMANTVNHNQGLPKMVEPYMQELAAKGTDGVFLYRYRMVKVVASEFDSDAFVAAQKIAAARTQCGTPADTGNLVQQGVTVRYTYVDKANAEISTFDITADDCR